MDVDQSLQATQQQLQTVEQELSTGLAVNEPSDNPAAAVVIQQLQLQLQQGQNYSTNLNSANSQLSEVDNQLSSLETLLQQAQSIASANVGTDATASSRQSAAAVVQGIYSQALSVGNTYFNGSYLFGGENATTEPFTQSDVGLSFAGSSTTLQNNLDANTKMAFQVNGASVFGALSAQVQGSGDLTPAVTAQTSVTDLQGASQNGVQLGLIQVGNGVTNKIIDLSSAATIGGVVNAINSAGLSGVTASISGSSIVLSASGGANISVANVAGDSTASDLGIATNGPAGVGTEVNGEPLDAMVTPLTPLADLRGGSGLDTAGLEISNAGKTTDLSFAGDTTVQDMLNTINGASLGVTAEINSAGTGINIVNTIQGSTLTVGENGGTTATQLGVRTFSPATTLSQLNNGAGVDLASSGADLQITERNGTSFQVSLAGAKTVQDVINDINGGAGGGGVTASFSTQGNGIVLTDTTGGTGTLSVTALNNSQAVSDLGLTAPANGSVLTGTDPNGVSSTGILSDLQSLESALTNNNAAGITSAAQLLQNDYTNVTNIRGANGAAMQEVQNMQDSLTTQTTTTQSLLSQVQDTNYTQAITQFQTLQTSLEAGMMVSAQTLPLSLIDFLQ
jgi:flagellar hook-associated protein 3 FlgL